MLKIKVDLDSFSCYLVEITLIPEIFLQKVNCLSPHCSALYENIYAIVASKYRNIYTSTEIDSFVCWYFHLIPYIHCMSYWKIIYIVTRLTYIGTVWEVYGLSCTGDFYTYLRKMETAFLNSFHSTFFPLYLISFTGNLRGSFPQQRLLWLELCLPSKVLLNSCHVRMSLLEHILYYWGFCGVLLPTVIYFGQKFDAGFLSQTGPHIDRIYTI